MVTKAERGLSEDENRIISDMIREELARRRITRQSLAENAKISLSTLEKALSGKRPFTLATLVRLEDALGVSLRNGVNNTKPQFQPGNGLAAETLGSYARPAVSWIEGDYLTLRPSFGTVPAIYAYRTQISWNDDSSRLTFREYDRIDAEFTQWGDVSIPHQSGHIYLITNRHGQYRMIVVARPNISGELHGILTTLQAGRGSQLIPTSTPIVLIPLTNSKAQITEDEHVYGRIPVGSKTYEKYKIYLEKTVTEPYALFLKT